MNAICTKCGREAAWRPVKGNRLENIPCVECGGRLRGKTYNRPSPMSGKRYMHCVVCGKKRNTEKLMFPGRSFTVQNPRSQKVHPAGSPVCFPHRPVAA